MVVIGPVDLEKKMKMWKVYRRTDRQTDRQTTDDRWSEKLTWAFSSGELKTCLFRLLTSYICNRNKLIICYFKDACKCKCLPMIRSRVKAVYRKSSVLCHLKTLSLYTGLFNVAFYHYMTNVAWVKITYWDWPHDVTVTWYSLIILQYLGHV